MAFGTNSLSEPMCRKPVNQSALRHEILIYLYVDNTQLYIKLSSQDIDDAKIKIVAGVQEIQSWCSAMRLKLNASKTELIWFNRKAPRDDARAIQTIDIDEDCSIVPSEVVRDLGVLLDCGLTMTISLLSSKPALFTFDNSNKSRNA